MSDEIVTEMDYKVSVCKYDDGTFCVEHSGDSPFFFLDLTNARRLRDRLTEIVDG